MSDLKSVGIKCEKLKMGFAPTVLVDQLKSESIWQSFVKQGFHKSMAAIVLYLCR